MKLTALLLCLQLLLLGNPAEGSTVSSCPNNNSFDTFVHIRFRFGLYELPLADIQGIPTNITEAYNVLAGLDCDPCARRIVAVTAESPPDLVALLSGASIQTLDSQDFAFDAEEFTALFRLTIEQTGNCDMAFDSTERIDYNVTPWDYQATCPNLFFEGSDNCCYYESPPCTQGGQGLAIPNFNSIFEAKLGYPVGRIIELQPAPAQGQAICDGSIQYYTEDEEIEFDGLLDVLDYEEFVADYLSAYNEDSFERCAFQQLVQLTILDDIGSGTEEIVNRRLGTGHRRLRSRFYIRAVYGCAPNVCPFRRRLISGEPKSIVWKNPKNGFVHAGSSRLLSDADTRPLSRKLQLSSFFIQNCLCQTNATGTAPKTFDLATDEEIIANANEMLAANGEITVRKREAAQGFVINEEEETAVYSFPVIMSATGNPCTRETRDKIYRSVADAYNDMTFQDCDPFFRRIQQIRLDCEDPNPCMEDSLVRGTMTLNVRYFGDVPEDDILFYTNATASPKNVGKGSKGKGSSSGDHLRNLAEVSCSRDAVGFQVPTEEGFLENFARNFVENDITGVHEIDFLFGNTCTCDTGDATESYEEDGVTYLPSTEKVCSGKGKSKGKKGSTRNLKKQRGESPFKTPRKGQKRMRISRKRIGKYAPDKTKGSFKIEKTCGLFTCPPEKSMMGKSSKGSKSSTGKKGKH